eukprot:Ihof_evm5s69 gene=Ihof_evmTU5s69
MSGVDVALEYNFAGDERWAAYLEGLTFGGGAATEEQMKKVKRKWFKKNIDPSYELPVPVSKPQARTPSPPSTPPHPSTPPPKPQSRAQPSQKPKTGNGVAQWQALKTHIIQYPVRTGHISLNLFAMVMWTLYFMSLGTVTRVVKYGLAGLIVTYLTTLYVSHGMPRFNQDYARRITPDANLHFFIYCVIFLSIPPMMLTLLPLYVYSIYNTCDGLRSLAGILYPGRAKDTRVEKYLDAKRTWLLEVMNRLEVYSMAVIVISVI